MSGEIHIRMIEENEYPFLFKIISESGNITEVQLNRDEVLSIENSLRRLRKCYEEKSRLHQGYH